MRRIQKTLALVMALVCCFGLCCPVASAATETPTPPAWLPADEYVIFEGDPVYESEAWREILAFRAFADEGHTYEEFAHDKTHEFYNLHEFADTYGTSSGTRYEVALIVMQLGMNDKSGKTNYGAHSASRLLHMATLGLEKTDPRYTTIDLWMQRANFLKYMDNTSAREFETSLIPMLYRWQKEGAPYTQAELFDHPWMERMSEASMSKIETSLAAYTLLKQTEVNLNLDGVNFTISGTQPETKNNRVMLPIRSVAELLGAVVEWDGATQTITMTRAGTVVKMVLGSTAASVNGTAITMDVAPYAIGGRTLIPVRYMSEFFDQTVEWDDDTRTVFITENKSLAGDSNLEAWALPMGAMLAWLNGGDEDWFGLYARAGALALSIKSESLYAHDLAVQTLSESWSINSRADLIDTIYSMTYFGHNARFLSDVAYIDALTTEQYNQYLQGTGVDSYMFPYTKELGEKWGNRGILCWDLFRMSNLAQWGYNAGYLSYTEALAMIEPAATLLKENFSSWDEAYENYLDGYNWWARNNVRGKDVFETSRGKHYIAMKNAEHPVFDDSLFQTDIIPVPDVNASDLVKSILA